MALDALAATDDLDAAIAAAPVTDTIKRVNDDVVVETLDRSALWAVQTPQVFRRGALQRALDVPGEVLAQATDDAWLVERLGGRVAIVPSGSEKSEDHHAAGSGACRAAARPPAGIPAVLLESPRAMLTDYHLHLRPDDLERPRRGALHRGERRALPRRREKRGIAELGVSEHVYRFEQALTVWQHPLWREYAIDDLDAYCEFVREHTDLRLGIEADFVPGSEDHMANLLDDHDFDYVVGSVHFLRDESIDMDDYSVWDRGHSAEEIWRRYFQTLGRGRSQWPVRHPRAPRPGQGVGRGAAAPEGDLRRYYEPAIEAIAESGIAIEVSTAGLRKRAQRAVSGASLP